VEYKAKGMKKQPVLLLSFVFAFFIFHFSFAICHAFDFGLVTDTSVELFDLGNEDFPSDGVEIRSDIVPSLSFLVGDAGELFLSAGLTIGVKEKKFHFVPELLRTELSYRFGSWGINAGRMQYTDPLGFITSGLFDGVRVSHHSTLGSFGFGVWYTGLLYKMNANITMTPEELAHYYAPFSYGNFFDSYFAPGRFIASLDWMHMSLTQHLQLKAAVTAQVDLSNGDYKYHSQYFTVKGIGTLQNFIFELGGSLETAELKTAGTDEAVEDANFNVADFQIAFALDFGIFWTPPTTFISRLSLTGRYTSGHTAGTLGAFIPVTNIFHGNVLKARLPGISIFTLDYTAYLVNSLEASLSLAYFMRNDTVTYTSWPVDMEDNTGNFLGPELFAQLAWYPFSDLQVNFGAGVFLPALGNVNPGGKVGWRVGLSAIITIF
jgi:hypothetical protein